MGVARPEFAERPPEVGCREHVDRGVQLPDLSLLGRGVPFLDDRSEFALLVTHDTAVGVVALGLDREEGHGGSFAAALVDELFDRLGGEKRSVSGEDEKVALEPLQGLARGCHRIAGAARLLLHDDLDARKGGGELSRALR